MFKHLTHTHDWFLPTLLILLGGLIAVRGSSDWWVWVSVLLWGEAVLVSVWLILCAYFDGSAELVREQTTKTDTDIKLYQIVHNLTEEEKAQMGLGIVKDTITLEMDRTQARGAYSKGFRVLSVSSAKMKAISYACLTGTPFTIRAMAGQGKILSPEEYRQLRDELLEYELLVPRSDKDDRQGYDWTEDGKRFLQEVVDSPL